MTNFVKENVWTSIEKLEPFFNNARPLRGLAWLFFARAFYFVLVPTRPYADKINSCCYFTPFKN